MTLTGLKGIENQITELRLLLASDPQSDEALAWLATLTPYELDTMSEIFLRHAHLDDLPYENLTQDELAFLKPIFERVAPSVPHIDRNDREHLCMCCECRPGVERGDIGEGCYWCDQCFSITCPATLYTGPVGLVEAPE